MKRTLPTLACALLLGAQAPQLSAADLNNSMFRLEMHLAERGDPEAQLQVAERYESGDGVPQDFTQAMTWYNKAAAQNHPTAYYHLGRVYLRGLGVPADAEHARSLLEKAKGLGSKAAERLLTSMDEESRKAEQAQEKQVQREEQKRKAEEEKQAKERARKAKEEERKRQEADNQRKAEERKRAQAAKAATAAPSAAELAALSAVAAATPSVASAPATPKRPDFGPIEALVLGQKWSFRGAAADQLPSPSTSCLKAGEELVCFSREQQRSVAKERLTYTTKAVISAIDDANGSFNLSYVYNVLEIDDGEGGPAQDPLGLLAVEGWQKPGIELTCQAKSKKELLCRQVGGQGELTFQAR